MRNRIGILFLGLLCVSAMSAQMYDWRSHLAYGQSQHIEISPEEIYVQSGAALYSVNRHSDDIATYSKQNGLNGSAIATITYSFDNRCLVIIYEDGLVDFMYDDGRIIPMTDLQQKEMTISKKANSATMDGDTLFVAMPFGIMVLDVSKRQVTDTYYIGADGSETNVMGVALTSDSIFAISETCLYAIARSDNRMDYTYWHRANLPQGTTYAGIGVCDNQLYALQGDVLAKRVQGAWQTVTDQQTFIRMTAHDGRLYVYPAMSGYYEVKATGLDYYSTTDQVWDVFASGTEIWLALGNKGAMRIDKGETQLFHVDGPVVNIPYRLKIANRHLYVVPGQRWATEAGRDANIMIYDMDNDNWKNISAEQIGQQSSEYIFDLMNVAVDPFDPEHFYVTSYGKGLLECRGTDVVNHFTKTNSVLETAGPGPYELNYVRTDGALFDAEGNLWFINTDSPAKTSNDVHIATQAQLAQASRTGQGQWYKMSLIQQSGEAAFLETPGEMFIDNRNPNWKWIPILLKTTGLVLLDDGGTPQKASDDIVIYRNIFKDQDGNTVKPEYIYTVAQDKEGALWVALENGLITIPATVDFRASNACERIKIPRNDGTNLADYLLNTEKINTIAVDGANRKWVGTVASGLYLLSPDGLETVEHFTTDNSPLLSDEILSIAIDPISGKVFIGTGKGLMSYQSDASSPFEDYSDAYAYPNPVRPDYEGIITITGLMDETAVHIVDNAGNLVCQTRSNGGVAVWDGKTPDGRRVAPGVYSVLCNESSDNKHAVIKILVMR